MHAGTIVASNYLAMAQVLGESFLEHHPASTFSVLVVDDGAADLPADMRVVRLGDLDIAPRDERLMRTVYDVMEFSTAVKPSFLRYLLEAGNDVEAACYLDPDIQVFAPFGPQADAALEHGIVLTPHVLEPVPRDGLRVDEETIMQSGMYNCGFLAVGPTARPFLDWWDERLRFDALVDFGRARFTDQRWVDWVPSLFGYTIDRDPGMNVAWWNIHDRPIHVEPSGATVQGRPLRFVHFSGYDPQQPELLSKHQLPRPRTEHTPGTGIRTLSDAYGARLVELGHVERRRDAYPWNRSHDGVELTNDLRRLVRDAALGEIDRFGEVRTVPDAFDPSKDFAGWVSARTDPQVMRTSPEPFEPLRSDSETQRNAYDVEFDWSDAHGHAVRLVLDHCEPGVVVDLGCGYAPHAEELRDAGFDFVGLDIDDASLAQLTDRGFVGRRADLGRADEIDSIIDDALAELGSESGVVAVMALDVLEHLIEPERLLATLARRMSQDDALLVTSVPNVAHRDIAAKLLSGRWDVTPTGLLDHTHLRFFTSASITEVMASAGFVEAARNDRKGARSDQRWPAGAPFTSPHTPLASLVDALRDLGDDHGDTYQMIRAYRAADAEAETSPTLMVADPTPPRVALTVIADPSSDEDERAQLQAQLEAQTSGDWELLATEGRAERADERVASFRSLVDQAAGAYVAFVERSERIGPRWVEQFVEAMTTTVAGGAANGDVSGHVLRCAVARHDPAGDPSTEQQDPTMHPVSASLAFPTAAVRALQPDFDGRAHQAMRLRAHLAPLCGEVETGVAAVVAGRPHTDGAWTLDAIVAPSPVAATLSAAAELPGVVASLRADVERLQAENERLARDNAWLNAELSPVPVRLVRRALRRDASSD